MVKPIQITHRLGPFSHLPGTFCLIPGTCYAAKIYPTLIQIYDLSGPSKNLIQEITLSLKGPMDPFMVIQDLERGEIRVFGRQSSGDYFQYRLTSSLELLFEKGFLKKEKLALKVSAAANFFPKERLFLGKTKKQEWERIKERRDLAEIFPLWLALGNTTPHIKKAASKNTMEMLLDHCKAIIEQKAHEKIEDAFLTFFLAFFENMLVPRLVDTEYQGILPSQDIPDQGSPLTLLHTSAELIRSLFFKHVLNSIWFLPHLPPGCPSGKMTGIEISSGKIDFEWTKKSIRRIFFRSTMTGEIFFLFPPKIKHYRLRLSPKERGIICESKDPLLAQSGASYYLDLFET